MSSMNNVTNPVFAAEQTAKINTLKWELGENGSPQLSDYGMCSDNSDLSKYCAALCALSNKLTRGTTSKKPIVKGNGQHSNGSNIGADLSQIQRLIQNVNVSITEEVGLSAGPEARAMTSKVLEDLVLMTFNLRDVRGTYGRGERTLSYWMFMNLFKMRPNPVCVLLRELPNYGGWMDINNLYEMTFNDAWTSFLPAEKITMLRNELATTYATQLVKDIMNLEKSPNPASTSAEKITLAAKWVPKEGRSLDKRTRMGKHIARLMYPSLWESDFKTALKHYRTDISKLGAHLDVVERKMASTRREWSAINFDKMPGRAMAKRTKAWNNKTAKGETRSTDRDRVMCSENYQKYLASLSSGKKTAKGRVMFVHEIANKLVDLNTTHGHSSASSDEIILFESMMDDHLNSIVAEVAKNPGNNLGNTAVMADVSGSMLGDPMAVSYAMAVLASHPKIASPAWANIVMTFSSKPEWIRLQYPDTFTDWQASSYETLLGKSWSAEEAGRQLSWSEKLSVVSKMPWGMSTDFISALNLVATRANEAGVKMPNLLCISDMQWDQATNANGIYQNYGNKAISVPLNYGPLHDFRCDTRTTQNAPTTLMRQIKAHLASEPCGNAFTTILWNVRGGTSGHPCAADENSFVEVAGFSTNMLKLFLNEGILDPPKSGSDSSTTWSTLRAMLDHEDYDRIRELTNLLKPWRNTDIRPLTVAEKSLLPTMKIPNDWRFSNADSGNWPGVASSRPVPRMGLPTSLHPPKLHRGTAIGPAEANANVYSTGGVYDYYGTTEQSWESTSVAGVGSSSATYPTSSCWNYSDQAQKSPIRSSNLPVYQKTYTNCPIPPAEKFKPVVNLTADPARTRIDSRMDELEKRLATVTAERDALRSKSSSTTKTDSEKSEIQVLKEMMAKILARET